MGRPLIILALLLSCVLAAAGASAQVERDSGSRARAGNSGVSRDVFTGGRPRGNPVEEPATEFQVSPLLEVAAISISFSIKGTAREFADGMTIAQTVTDAGEVDAAPGLAPEDLPAALAVAEPADSAAVESLESEAEPPVPNAVDEIAGSAAETATALAELAEPAPVRPVLRDFGDFPESGGTEHDTAAPDDGAAAAAADDGVEPQLDQPEFLDEGQAADAAERRLLSADGKGALAFDSASAEFALPDGVLAPGLDGTTGAGGFDIHAGVMAPDWTTLRIPSSMTELSRGNKRKRRVALTFDDGPHPEYTDQILSILSYYDVPATFFFVGIQCVKYPQLVQQAYQQGAEIGSQTYDHFRMPNLPKEEKEYQIDEYQLLIQRLTGTAPRFLRPPGGQIDDQTRSLLRERGIVLALWDVALNDTKDGKTAAEMLETAKARVRPGSVILAHDGVKATVELLPQLIEELHRQGYEFVTMSELAADL